MLEPLALDIHVAILLLSHLKVDDVVAIVQLRQLIQLVKFRPAALVRLFAHMTAIEAAKQQNILCV